MKNVIFIVMCSIAILSQAQKKEQKLSSKDTGIWEPVPPTVTPANKNNLPSDAIILFNGGNFNNWVSTKDSGQVDWILNKDKSMTVSRSKVNAGIKTKESFGSMQLHLEWKSPKSDLNKFGQHRGNSGVFIQERYEIQILDNNNNPTYSNGQVSSIYKQTIPLVKASVPTGEWNNYDIIYHAPEFKEDKTLTKPATITVIHNGILVIDHFTLKGSTKFIGTPEYKAHGEAPIMLQNHDSPVSYRNIWLRKL
ncbi:DUF1080 domain-containing protein [Flavicella sp.]|uniref:3-keto-disaccharide hydrolase n=1 Tax=Flavicella sp. TaxID=2957742 RepID=UPI003018D329